MTTAIHQSFVDDAAEDSGSDFEVVRDRSVTETKFGDLVVFEQEENTTEESEVDDDYDDEKDEEEEIEIERIEMTADADKVEKPAAVHKKTVEQFIAEAEALLLKNDDELKDIGELKAMIAAQNRKIQEVDKARWMTQIFMCLAMIGLVLWFTYNFYSFFLQAQGRIEELNQKIKEQQQIIDEATPAPKPKVTSNTSLVSVFASLLLCSSLISLIHFGTKGASKKEEQVKELKSRLAEINNKVQQYKDRERKRKAIKYQNRRKNVAKDVA